MGRTIVVSFGNRTALSEFRAYSVFARQGRRNRLKRALFYTLEFVDM